MTRTIEPIEATCAVGAAWEGLCDALERELDRQARVLELCQEQGRAARARDIESLDALTRELVDLMESVIGAEHARHLAVRRVLAHYGLSEGDHNLSSLIALAPATWRGRLKACRLELRSVLQATQCVARANRRYLQQGARTADRLLAGLFGRETRNETYGRAGDAPAQAQSGPAVLNTAG